MISPNATESSWFSVDLKKPYLVLPPQHSQAQVVTTATELDLEGIVSLTFTKQTKVRSLRLRFVGVAKSSFFINTTRIAGAKPCTPYDRYNYGSYLFNHPLDILLDDTKDARTFSTGRHTFPFKFPVPTSLPASTSAASINIHYQVVATLGLVSFLSFAQSHQTSQAVVLLQGGDIDNSNNCRNNNLSGDVSLFAEGGIMPLTTSQQGAAILEGRITAPCRIFTQGAIIPLTFNLDLRGNTAVSKVAFELWESIAPLQLPDHEQRSRSSTDTAMTATRTIATTTTTTTTAASSSYIPPSDIRLVSRQSCPVKDWPASRDKDIRQPLVISKRLLFKVPMIPLDFWTTLKESETVDDIRCSLPKGYCHTSGTYQHLGFEISHRFRAIVYYGAPESEGDRDELETAEHEMEVHVRGQHQWIAQEEQDGNHLPSYSRSFSHVLVNDARIEEVDRHLHAMVPPVLETESDYRYVDDPSMRPSFDTFISRPSTDTFLSDLVAHSHRHAFQ